LPPQAANSESMAGTICPFSKTVSCRSLRRRKHHRQFQPPIRRSTGALSVATGKVVRSPIRRHRITRRTAPRAARGCVAKAPKAVPAHTAAGDRPQKSARREVLPRRVTIATPVRTSPYLSRNNMRHLPRARFRPTPTCGSCSTRGRHWGRRHGEPFLNWPAIRTRQISPERCRLVVVCSSQIDGCHGPLEARHAIRYVR